MLPSPLRSYSLHRLSAPRAAALGDTASGSERRPGLRPHVLARAAAPTHFWRSGDGISEAHASLLVRRCRSGCRRRGVRTARAVAGDLAPPAAWRLCGGGLGSAAAGGGRGRA